MTFDITPLQEPRFCQQCGGPMRLQHVAEEDRERLLCPACGFIHYMNPRVVANAVPEIEGADGSRRLLLMRRAFEPRRGFWSPPGGFVELGESPEEAAARETLEEVGLAVEPFALLGVYSRSAIGIVVVAYRARALALEATPGIEALEARWFTPETIPWDDLAYETTALALRDWMAALGASG